MQGTGCANRHSTALGCGYCGMLGRGCGVLSLRRVQPARSPVIASSACSNACTTSGISVLAAGLACRNVRDATTCWLASARAWPRPGSLPTVRPRPRSRTRTGAGDRVRQPGGDAAIRAEASRPAAGETGDRTAARQPAGDGGRNPAPLPARVAADGQTGGTEDQPDFPQDPPAMKPGGHSHQCRAGG